MIVLRLSQRLLVSCVKLSVSELVFEKPKHLNACDHTPLHKRSEECALCLFHCLFVLILPPGEVLNDSFARSMAESIQHSLGANLL